LADLKCAHDDVFHGNAAGLEFVRVVVNFVDGLRGIETRVAMREEGLLWLERKTL